MGVDKTLLIQVHPADFCHGAVASALFCRFQATLVFVTTPRDAKGPKPIQVVALDVVGCCGIHFGPL